MSRRAAAMWCAREVSLTVLSMSLSLLAVFVPILLMGGIVGRYFREFAVTLSVANAASLAVSLTVTPMMCAYLADQRPAAEPGRLVRWSERAFAVVLGWYDRSLQWALLRSRPMMAILLAVLGLSFYLFYYVPKSFFPQQDTGRPTGWIQPDQTISFQLMRRKLEPYISVLNEDPAVESAAGYTWGYCSSR
jgi:multidrug efflux pump